MKLGLVIADFRFANRLGVREVARDIGISHSTLSRIERGENCDAISLSRIICWMLSNIQPKAA